MVARHLVVRILLDEEDLDGLWRRLGELVCSAGVAAWQVDHYDHDELGQLPGQDLIDGTVAAVGAVGR